MHRRSGFTIVELLIVIVVIAILAAISLVAYNGIQQRARDSERRNDIASIEKVLEMYYIDNNMYPNFYQLSDPTWRQANLATRDQGIFINPQDSGSANSIVASGSVVALNKYSYYGVNNSGGTVCQSGEVCTGYRMTWKLEENSTTNISRTVNR